MLRDFSGYSDSDVKRCANTRRCQRERERFLKLLQSDRLNYKIWAIYMTRKDKSLWQLTPCVLSVFWKHEISSLVLCNCIWWQILSDMSRLMWCDTSQSTHWQIRIYHCAIWRAVHLKSINAWKLHQWLPNRIYIINLQSEYWMTVGHERGWEYAIRVFSWTEGHWIVNTPKWYSLVSGHLRNIVFFSLS